MTVDHFKVNVDPDGCKYVYQAIDEHDENHGINDDEPANQAKMYDHPTKFLLLKYMYILHKKN